MFYIEVYIPRYFVISARLWWVSSLTQCQVPADSSKLLLCSWMLFNNSRIEMGLYIYKLNQISLDNGIPWNHVELKSIRSVNIEVLNQGVPNFSGVLVQLLVINQLLAINQLLVINLYASCRLWICNFYPLSPKMLVFPLKLILFCHYIWHNSLNCLCEGVKYDTVSVWLYFLYVQDWMLFFLKDGILWDMPHPVRLNILFHLG